MCFAPRKTPVISIEIAKSHLSGRKLEARSQRER